ncbi:hypothetical protein [Diaminobutyricimonas sp. TR449]|uniref:hypothetical protein n=1 Tax=Diaminobutyricimonas sp. TR449 TaxID=2708076 RepID=UPI001422778E|nr:hypothetical protein [Diaminobutyricimonas sp. TR449]
MKLADILRAAGRRWYVLVAGFLATAGLAYGILQIVPITYDLRASFLLIPPPLSTEERDANPFLHLGGLDIVAGVLAKALNDESTVEEVIPKGDTTEYTVQADGSVPGSVLEIVTVSEEPDVALSVTRDVLARAEVRLAELQDAVDAHPRAEIDMMVITDNTKATPDPSGLVRALIAAIGAGLAITFLLAVSVDALVLRRRDRRSQRSVGHADAVRRQPSRAIPATGAAQATAVGHDAR